MSEQKFKTTITSRHRLFDLHLKETFKYRDLIWLFVKRDFVALYKQTILGPLWAIIQPVLTTFVFSFIFGTIAGLGGWFDIGEENAFNIPRFLFYMSGTMLFTYFSSNVTKISKIFIENRATMGKVYYPRLVQPIAASLSNLIPFVINFALFLIVWLVFLLTNNDITMYASWWLLLIPALIVQIIILSMGIGLVISAVTTKYRDLQMLVGFGLQLWQYASPIAYGLALINNGHPELLMAYTCVNPLTPIVTSFRLAMFGVGYFNYIPYLVSWGITLFVFFAGLMLFSKTEKNFMDTI
jgi:lipopolysaccharide transport system permease protein